MMTESQLQFYTYAVMGLIAWGYFVSRSYSQINRRRLLMLAYRVKVS